MTELIGPDAWQHLQDHLSRVLGIPIRTLGRSHELLAHPSWPAHLMSDAAMGLIHAGEELDELLPLQQLPEEMTSFTTALGASYAAVPIRATPELAAGFVVLGPVVVGVREDEVEFRRRMNQLGLDATAIWPVLLSLKLFSFSGLRAVMALVETLGNLLAAKSYRAAMAEENASGGLQVAESGNYEKAA